jgi:hypothetical protein
MHQMLTNRAITAVGALLVLAAGINTSLPARALTSVDELQDVKPDHWATPAITKLVDKDIIEGQPNSTYQGNKATTRNELAVVLNALLNSVERDLAQQDAQKADKREVQVLSNLQQQLAGYISTLGNDVKTLQGDINENKGKNTDQDRRLGLLEKTQIHGDLSLGVLSDMGSGRGSKSRDGIKDAASALGRLRLTIDTPVIEDKEDSKLGSGVVHARLVAAYGRYASIGTHNGSLTDYPFNLYSRISTDVSAFNEGYGTGSVGNLYGQNGNTSILRPNIYLESAFYTQHLKSGIPLLTNLGLNGKGDKWQATGDAYTGIVRWWDYFDVSPYRGNEMAQFQNNAFINIPGIAVNVAQPMVGYQWHQGLGNWASADVGTALGSIDTADLADGLNVTYEGKLNYNTGFLGEKLAKPGSLYVGGYHMYESGNRRFSNTISSLNNRALGTYSGLSQRSSGNAVYAGWNQEWWRGIGTNVGFLVNNTAPIIVAGTTMQPGPARVAGAAKTAFTSVMQIPLSAFGQWRPKDVIGLGYGFVDLQEGGIPRNLDDTYEQVMEFYYRYQVTDSFSIVPSCQLIVNRLGLKSSGTDVVLGLRMNHTF